jgi:hypothetical protein
MNTVTLVTLFSAMLLLALGFAVVESRPRSSPGGATRLAWVLIAFAALGIACMSALAIRESMTLGRGLFILGQALVIVIVWRAHRRQPSAKEKTSLRGSA